MNAWAFVIAAYGLTIAATAATIGLSWAAMRRAETATDALTKS